MGSWRHGHCVSRGVSRCEESDEAAAREGVVCEREAAQPSARALVHLQQHTQCTTPQSEEDTHASAVSVH
jgi:hypothetical protein